VCVGVCGCVCVWVGGSVWVGVCVYKLTIGSNQSSPSF